MSDLRALADQAFSRAAGAPLVGGNAVRLLRDAAENFPAWREALGGATRSILVESYIFDDDETGAGFRDLLVEKARDGVRVRVVRDWLGSVLERRWRGVKTTLSGGPGRRSPVGRARSGGAGRAAAGTLGIGSAVRHAITRPRAVAWPFAAVAVWFGLAVLLHAWRGYRAVRRSGADRRKRESTGG